MKFFKAPPSATIIGLVLIRPNVVASFINFYHDHYGTDELPHELSGELFEFEDQLESPQITPFVRENEDGDAGNIYYSNEVYLDNSTTPRVDPYYISSPKWIHSISPPHYFPQSNPNNTPNDGLHQDFRAASFNPYTVGAPVLIGRHAPPNNQGPVGPFHPNQSHYINYGQPAEDNIPHVHHRTSKVLPALTKISELDQALREKIEASKFYGTEKAVLWQRSISKPKFKSFNGVFYSSFLERSERQVYGRTGNLNLYIKITPCIIFLFEMKPGFHPPRRLTGSDSMKSLGKVRDVLQHAIWSIQIGSFGELIKSGADPSETMTLWVITSEKVKKINLKNKEISNKSFLRKGGLIVAIPTQLNDLMATVKAGTSYDNFRGFIERSVDFGLDQLILIIKVYSRVDPQKNFDDICVNDQSKGSARPITFPGLIRISQIDEDVKKRAEEDGFHMARNKKLCYRCLSGGYKFSKGKILATFQKRAGEYPFGRIAKLELYIRVTKTRISLFEMKDKLKPSMGRRFWGTSKLDSLQKLFGNAKWSVHIGVPEASGSTTLIKLGDGDPSSVISFWVIPTNGEPYRINLDDQQLRKNFLLQKRYILAITPVQLDEKLRTVRAGIAYEDFLDFIDSLIDKSLDQIIFIAEA